MNKIYRNNPYVRNERISEHPKNKCACFFDNLNQLFFAKQKMPNIP